MTEALASKEIEVGDVAPNFTLKDQDGNPVALSGFQGKKNKEKLGLKHSLLSDQKMDLSKKVQELKVARDNKEILAAVR